jgi:DNA-binding transcriptional LysR family regulator
MLDPLTLDQLRVLVAIAETGSFSAAARRLQRAQSAISQAAQAAENTLQVQFFDRSAKLPKLTDAGRILIEDAKSLLKGVAAFRSRAEEIVGGVEPELTIAVDHFMPRGPATKALRALRERFPDLPVTLLTEGMGAVERHLRSGTARLAIYPAEITRDSDFQSEFLVDIAMVPVVSSDHPLAKVNGRLSREELGDHVQLLLTDWAPPGSWPLGMMSHKLWRFADLNTRLNFLIEGFGWCYMPLSIVQPHITEGLLKRLRLTEMDQFNLALHVVHERGRSPGIAGRWMIDQLKQALAEGAAAQRSG